MRAFDICLLGMLLRDIHPRLMVSCPSNALAAAHDRLKRAQVCTYRSPTTPTMQDGESLMVESGSAVTMPTLDLCYSLPGKACRFVPFPPFVRHNSWRF